jgi:hypothetical protein
MNWMKNNYEIRGDIALIFLNSPKYGSMETIIDSNDLTLAQEIEGFWHPHWDHNSKNFYVRGNATINGKKTKVLLHRWITRCLEYLKIDHIDHNGLNNRRSCNLRESTNAQNAQNRQGANRNNKSSGIRGVHWNKPKSKWRATVIVNGVYKHFGHFDDKEKAEMVVEKARAKLMPFSKEGG